MITDDLAELRDGLDRQLDRLHAAIELFQATIEPGRMTRAERGLDVVIEDAIEAADRHVTLAAHLQIEAAKSATILAEHLTK